MSDISPVYGVTDWGSILSSLPSAMSNIRSQTAQQVSTMAGIPVQQAEAQNIQAQAQGQQLQNEKTGIMLDLFRKNAMSQQAPAINDSQAPLPDAVQSLLGAQQPSPDTSGAAPQSAAAAVSSASGEPANTDGNVSPTSAIDPSAIATMAEKKYAVRDIWNAQETQQLAAQPSQRMLGLPDNTQNIIAQHKARIDSQTSAAQLAASDAYDQMLSVVKAPDGTALNQLARLKANAPDGQTGRDAAERVQAMADKNNWTPQQTDQFVRDYATESANQVHRWSGRPIDIGTDGIARDATTKQPVPGAVPIGLSANEYREGLQEAQKLVTVKNSDGSESEVPTWKYNNAASPQAWANQWVSARAAGSAASARSTQNATTAAAPPPAASAPASASAPPGAGASGAAPAAAAPSATAPAPAAAPAQPRLADPVLKTALSDTSYRSDVPPTAYNRSQTPGDQKLQEQAAESNNTLRDDGREMTQSGARALTFLTAAKAVMNSGGTPTGLAAPVQVAVSRALSALGLGPGDYAAHYQEVSKYLGNQSVAMLKELSNRPSTKELQISMQELNPNLNMQSQAASNLIDTNIRQAQYAIDTAHRIPAYLVSRNEPRSFYDWNQTYWPREKIVAQPTTPATTATAPETRTYQGKSYTYNGTGPRNDPKSWAVQ